jgi:uncharacterized protein (DUF58 family)
VAVRLRDPRERELPPVGLVRWVDAESGRGVLVDASREETRREYAARVRGHDEQLERLLRRCQVDLVDVQTDRSYVEPLQAFFARRERRRRRGVASAAGG